VEVTTRARMAAVMRVMGVLRWCHSGDRS
jgi:hypothetical protein